MAVLERKSALEIVLALSVVLVSTSISMSPSPASGALPCTNWAGLFDNDCDGLADTWEQNGYDINGDAIIDLTFPDANKDRKDIYVELDFMKDNNTNRDHTPRAGVVQAVIDAFNDAPVSNPAGQPDGINLHIVVNEQIPHVDSITMWSGFDALKNTWFGESNLERSQSFKMQAKDNTYHYVIFGHKYNGGTSSGLAEIPGDDFVVTLGASIWGSVNGHNVGSVDQQKGTLMHELGHNLNLRHGGNVDENCKPNYLSVMNYMFQFPNYVSDRPLDYSHSQLATLDENALHEPTGISPAADPTNQRSNWGVNGVPRGPTQYLSQLLNPIDWNKSGSVSGTKSVNINNLGASSGCTSTTLTPLAGFNDWGNLTFWGVTGGWGNGTIVSDGAGAGNDILENPRVNSSSIISPSDFNVINTTTAGNAIDITALGNQAVGINSSLLLNSSQGGVLNMTDDREGNREGLDEYNAENLVSSRLYVLESIIVEIDSLPDEDFSNKTSKATLLDSLRIIGDGFNSNSTDLAQSITDLSDIRNQTNSSIINPNTQKLIVSQMDNFVEGLKKQQ
jgi:hypothetical protein